MQTFIYHKNITNINTLLNIAGFDLKLYYWSAVRTQTSYLNTESLTILIYKMGTNFSPTILQVYYED